MFRSIGSAGNSSFLQYSESDWKVGNRAVLNLADGDCSKCEALVSEGRRLRISAQEQAAQKEREVERQFHLRISDVEFWRNELDNQLAELQTCNDLLTRLKTRLKATLEGCEFPARTCREVMVRRDERKGLDLVGDTAQKQVQKYLSLLYDTMAVCSKTIGEVEEQERTNRAVTNKVLRDLDDKFNAITIDNNALSRCREMGKPDGLVFNEQLLAISSGAVTLDDWESWTKHNVERADRERDCSDKLRPLIEQILRQAYEDLDLQRRKVLKSLKDRITELLEAKQHLEERLSNVKEQILEQQTNVSKLQTSRDENLSRLRLSHKRLEDRRHRSRMELVWDSVQLELEREAALLTSIIKNLDDKISEGSELLQQMEQTRRGLEKQIDQKKNTIFIERECFNLMSQISHSLP